MRKLTLDLDSLDVQSFATDEETPANGTVFGHTGYFCASTYYGCTYTDFETCESGCTCGQHTCEATCYWTCATCNGVTCELPC